MFDVNCIVAIQYKSSMLEFKFLCWLTFLPQFLAQGKMQPTTGGQLVSSGVEFVMSESEVIYGCTGLYENKMRQFKNTAIIMPNNIESKIHWE